MAYRKTNIGGLISYNPKEAAKVLLKEFSKCRGVYSDVATHYGVAITTVRRWVTTLQGAGVNIEGRIDRIRELAIQGG